MKLAILTSSLSPYPISGAEGQAAATAVQLAQRGHGVTVFSRRMLRDQPTIKEHDGVRWIRCSTIQALGFSFPTHIASFLKHWRGEHGEAPFDCILAYSMVINGVLGVLASKMTGVPLVLWVRSEQEIELRQQLKFRYLSPWILGSCHHALLQAKTIREAMLFELQRAGKSTVADRMLHHSSVLPNAVKLPIEISYSNRKGLVFVGRLAPEKGVDILFKALRGLDSPPSLDLVGDGPLRKELEDSSRDLPVTFHGYCQPEKVAELVGKAQALIAPSSIEGFPNVVLEGMALGVPAIASNVGGVGSLVKNGDNGFLLEAGNVEQLRGSIRTLLSDTNLWVHLARNARITAEGYGWAAHLRELETIFRNTVSDSSRTTFTE